ncbi:MFS transporter [Acrocarpospora macrocephala]|uniref:MFS transporter n=1 Tax=Acrocarpospora macrocephala TaxID=150177 RepID=A0A5M3X4D4_9ACTN|nr:MFS transporter [Acrocarpospora macrocephala]GES16577.1 MFS transporter [Acrocarpospora macrocephala]
MTTSTGAITFTRDRPTWLIYLILATFSSYLYGLSAAIPLLRAELGLTQAVAGLHATGMAVGSIVTGLAIPAITARIGRRAACWTGIAGMNVGMLIVAFGQVLPLTLLGYTIASGMAAITLFISMAVLSEHHGAAGPASIAEANAVGVLPGIVASYAFSVLAGTVLGWRSALFVPLILSALLALTMFRVWVPERPAAPVQKHGPRVPYGRRFHLAGAVLLCCVALEFSFNMWAAELLAQRTGLTAASATTGLTAMLIGVALGRLGGVQLALRFRVDVVLVGALLVALTGWAVFWTTTITVVAYAGLVITGLGIALQFPLALSRLIEASGGRPDQASGAASVWAGFGSGASPLVLGALGDGFGTHTAFLMAPVLIGLATGAVLSSRQPA